MGGGGGVGEEEKEVRRGQGECDDLHFVIDTVIVIIPTSRRH
jgi:hypothetical protein